MIDFQNGNLPVEHDYTHPERHFKGLVPAKPFREKLGYVFGKPPEEFPDDYERYADSDTYKELCWACGWSMYEQTTSSYGPRVKIMHARDNIGLWSIGSKWLLRDQPNDHTLGADYITWKFLREQPGLKIPLVEKMQILSDPKDPIQFTIISRAQGVHLSAVWYKLTPEQKENYKNQMADILKQLRQFTAPFPQKVNGDQLDDHLIGVCQRRHSPTCKKIGFTTEEWLDNMSDELRYGLSQIHRTKDPKIVEEKLREIKANFPSGGPYVLSHLDLNMSNIIVKDDKIEAIIDWEMAGYYPWWAEIYAGGICGGEAEYEFFKGVDGVWAKVNPDFTRESPVYKDVLDNLLPVTRAFARNVDAAEHTPPEDAHAAGFWRPPFCKCQPYGGTIEPVHLGILTEHKAKQFGNVDS